MNPERLREIAVYEVELQGLTGPEFNARFDAEQRAEQREAQFGNHRLDRGRYQELKITRIGLEDWAKASFWTVTEGVALICGMNPDELDVKKLTRIFAPEASPFLQRHLELLRHADRASKSNDLYARTPPNEFMAWAKGLELDFPPELDVAVSKYHEPVVDWQARCTILEKRLTRLQSQPASNPLQDEPADLKTRERTTLLKLVIALAVSCHGFDPRSERSDTAKLISEDLERLGLSLDGNTIRKWLKEASALVSSEDWNSIYR